MDRASFAARPSGLAQSRVVAAHLGSGASLCAMKEGEKHDHHGNDRAGRVADEGRVAAPSIPAR